MRRLALAGLALIAAPAAASAQGGDAAGADLYRKNCSVCHQAGGVGMAGAFPKLVGRGASLAGSPGGRRLMIETGLWGMSGRLPTEDGPVVGVMPGFAKLSDDELARVLTYVARLDGKAAPAFSPAEVAKLRAEPPLTPAQVNALAKELAGKAAP